jgi:hypothetical protein
LFARIAASGLLRRPRIELENLEEAVGENVGDALARDLAIIDDTGAAFTGMNADGREALVRETVRVLRPGGRVMVIGTTPATGVAAALSRSTTPPSTDPTSALQADGYNTVRLLAERQGLIFYEAPPQSKRYNPRAPAPRHTHEPMPEFAATSMLFGDVPFSIDLRPLLARFRLSSCIRFDKQERDLLTDTD